LAHEEISLRLPNYICSEWKEGIGADHKLVDPVTGEELAAVSSSGLDLRAALEHARRIGSATLQELTYQQRALLLGKIADVLTARRADYFDISAKNLGATQADAAFDIDGAIYTLKQYARLGQGLAGKFFRDGSPVPLSKTGVFQGQHFLKPLGGMAVFINAFNFPAWGLWEKASPAILSGVAVLVKPASTTAWLTHRMVEDVIKAQLLPEGALSIVCGAPRDLLDHVGEEDVITFTGSSRSASSIKTHPNVVARSVRVNIEADSLNSAVLGPDVPPGTQIFDLLAKEVVHEMTIKAGQKCTAIRRVLVSREHARPLAEAISGRLAPIKVGNPRNQEVKCGPLVNRVQQASVLEGLARLRKEAELTFGGETDFQPIDADRNTACFVQPTLLFSPQPLEAEVVNEVEIFGPVATICPYDSAEEAIEIARRGSGSLVASIFSDDSKFKREVVLGLAGTHGRIMVVDESVSGNHTGHGNVLPSCLHGGPGRAGGGEELGGLRALNLYHRRFTVQGNPTLIADLAEGTIDAASIYL
jgi:3,4-dehydroadipyl-CoA semialdehyde dehydrogenase